MATWKELEAQGVKRCCITYSNRRTGKHRRCRNRANAAGSWCDKHAPMMAKVDEWNRQAIEAERNHNDRTDEDE